MAVTEVKQEPIEDEEFTLNLINKAPSSKVCTVQTYTTTLPRDFSAMQVSHTSSVHPGGPIHVPGVWLWDC